MTNDDLIAALDDLRSRLRKRGRRSSKNILIEVANDWQLHPSLLERALTNQIGTPISDYPKEKNLRISSPVKRMLTVPQASKIEAQTMEAAFRAAIRIYYENWPGTEPKYIYQRDKNFGVFVKRIDFQKSATPDFLYVTGFEKYKEYI